jgi:hypothetical protein
MVVDARTIQLLFLDLVIFGLGGGVLAGHKSIRAEVRACILFIAPLMTHLIAMALFKAYTAEIFISMAVSLICVLMNMLLFWRRQDTNQNR